MSIARTIDGRECAILVHPDGTVVTGTGTGGGGGTTSVWSASDAAATGMTLSNGGLTVTPPAGGWFSIRTSIGKTSGKLYVEIMGDGGWYNAGSLVIGLANASFAASSYLGSSDASGGVRDGVANYVSSFTSNYPSSLPAAPAGANSAVWGLAVDFTAGKVWLSQQNTWSNGSDPAAGTAPILSFTPATVGALFAALSFTGVTASYTLQSTAASQKYAPPSGFTAWDAPVTPPPTTSVWSSSDATANAMTLSNGGLTVTQTSASFKSVRTSTSKTSGKLYVEFLANQSTPGDTIGYGLASSGFDPTNFIGSSVYSGGAYNTANHVSAGFVSNYAMSQGQTTGDVWALSIDFTAGNIWLAQNNVWVNSSNPATGTLPIISFTPATVGALFAALTLYATSAAETWTLQSTAASQKYAPPSGFSAWDSAVPTHSPQALAYLARTVGGDEGGNGANIATLIDGLVSDGVWAKLDALYVLAQQNQSDALLNLVGTSYTLTGGSLETIAPFIAPFTTYRGFHNFTSSMDTGFNALSAPSPHLTLNDGSIGVWIYDAADTNMQMGTQTSTAGNINIGANFGGSGTYYCQISPGASVGAPTPGTKGWFSGDKLSATSAVLYWNGASLGSKTQTTVPFDGVNIHLGGSDAATVSGLSAAFIGGSLGAAGQLALYNRLRTYMTAIGVP